MYPEINIIVVGPDDSEQNIVNFISNNEDREILKRNMQSKTNSETKFPNDEIEISEEDSGLTGFGLANGNGVS